ncbi:MAG: ATP-binding cassette domain-containing protein [Sumerlaeia bacterium]
MHIVIEDLHKRFGSNVVFEGVNLEIPAGQLCMIVGRSGIGKSVLLKHIVGLLQPDSGRILIDGQDIVGLSEKDLLAVRKRFGMIFQTGGLLQSLTVGQNVGLPLTEVYHEKPSEVDRIVAEKLNLVGLKGREEQSPSTLSGGQRKRAAIARALTTRAECFLFDEPTAGLDPPMAENVDDIVKKVNRDIGATVIEVTHDMTSVFELADVVHMLHDGKIVFSGDIHQLRDSGDPVVREFLSRDLQSEMTRQSQSSSEAVARTE